MQQQGALERALDVVPDACCRDNQAKVVNLLLGKEAHNLVGLSQGTCSVKSDLSQAMRALSYAKITRRLHQGDASIRNPFILTCDK